MRCLAFIITTFALTAIAIACVGVEAAQAADTCTWTGATNADWKTGRNWTGTGCTGANGPPAGSTLIFPSGASNLSTTNNIGTGDAFAITISGSGYTLAGDSVDVTGLTDSDTSGSNTISLNIAMTAASTFTVTNAAETLTVSGVISGAYALTKSGNGTLVLSGTNTYGSTTLNPETTISAGMLQISKDTNLGTAPTRAEAASITFNGGTLATTASFTLTTDRGMTFTSTGTIDVASGTTLTYGGVATGAGGLTMTDSGTLVLSGTSTYTGITTLDGGTLSISKDTDLGKAPTIATTGSITFNGGTLETTAGFTLTADRGIAFTQNGAIDVSTGTLVYGGIAAGTGTGFTLSGTGTFELSGANTYTGATTVSSGSTLEVGATNAVPSGSDVTVTGTFNLDGHADTIGSLAGVGTVEDSSATAATLTTNGDNSSTTFSGVIENDRGTVSLTKTGTGTLTLSGANTYTGDTTIDAGTLSVSADDNLGKAPTTVTAASLTFHGGTLATTASFTLTTDRGMTFTSTGTIDVASGTTLTYGGIAAGAGGLTLIDSGTLVLSGANTYSGTTTISAGTLTVDGSQSASAVSLNGGTLDGIGTVGAVTSTASGGTLAPGSGAPGILTSGNVNLSSGAPTFSVQLDGTTAGTNYNQLSTGGTINLTGATLSGSLGFTPASGDVFTIINNTGGNAITGTFSGLAEGATLTIGGHSFTISYVGGSGHSVTLTTAVPVLALVDSVSPSATGQDPGTNLTYTIAFTNDGAQAAVNTTITTPIPNSTDFELGSVTSSLGSTGLTVSVAYSDDGGTTYTYTPVSGGGGAAAGYDRNVTNIQWTLTGSLSSTSPNNAGNVSFTARIR